MRLNQPVGIWLLLWPCWWGLALAAGGLPPVSHLLLFGIGAVLMRSAGCIVNDMADRTFDALVERTKTRPLASGELTMTQAAILLVLLLLLALGIALLLGPVVMLWAALSLVPVAIYPFMKRISWWPQLFLGLTFNWGALMGYAAIAGTVQWPAIALYIGGIFWTLGYDTIYAHQDIADDVRAGVKSTARRLGNFTVPFVGGCYVLAVQCWLMAGLLAQAHLGFYVLMMIPSAHFIWQLMRIKLDDPAMCRRVFMSNGWLGLLVMIALCI